ncbi:MAG: hypothetical protein RSC68_31155, partial [Acinetobacter sp.]
MIKKSIKVVLAALLVFMVAVPVIVGVYDATNTRTNRATESAVGSLVSKSELQGGGEYTYSTDDITGDSAGYIKQGNEIIHEAATGQENDSLIDWYSGDPDISNSLAIGDTHLVHEFSDGSVVDFGNPYESDWTDVPVPDDYYAIISSAESTSFLSPEKAYAGPLGSLVNKAKYLAIKSGYWKSFNSMLYSLGITIAMSGGMTYTAATQCVNKIVAEMPAITRVISS